MKLFHKIIIIFGLVVVVVMLVFTSLFTYKIPLNNYRLKVFRENFHKSVELLHPKQSSLIAEVAEVGNWADGTRCQFLVGQFRYSSLSRDALKKVYPYDFFTAGIYFIDGNEDFDSPWFKWIQKYLKNYKATKNENIYLVWMAEDKSPDGDIRCD